MPNSARQRCNSPGVAATLNPVENIRITVDGKHALTTRQAAERYGIQDASMRTAIRRYEVEAIAHLDERTPLYPTAALDKVMRDRPGPGRPAKATTSKRG